MDLRIGLTQSFPFFFLSSVMLRVAVLEMKRATTGVITIRFCAISLISISEWCNQDTPKNNCKTQSFTDQKLCCSIFPFLFVHCRRPAPVTSPLLVIKGRSFYKKALKILALLSQVPQPTGSWGTWLGIAKRGGLTQAKISIKYPPCFTSLNSDRGSVMCIISASTLCQFSPSRTPQCHNSLTKFP